MMYLWLSFPNWKAKHPVQQMVLPLWLPCRMFSGRGKKSQLVRCFCGCSCECAWNIKRSSHTDWLSSPVPEAVASSRSFLSHFLAPVSAESRLSLSPSPSLLSVVDSVNLLMFICLLQTASSNLTRVLFHHQTWSPPHCLLLLFLVRLPDDRADGQARTSRHLRSSIFQCDW